MNSVKDAVAGRKPTIVIALGAKSENDEGEPMTCPMCKKCPAMKEYVNGGEELDSGSD